MGTIETIGLYRKKKPAHLTERKNALAVYGQEESTTISATVIIVAGNITQKSPTCNDEDVEERTCSVCGKSEPFIAAYLRVSLFRVLFLIYLAYLSSKKPKESQQKGTRVHIGANPITVTIF